MKGAVIFLAILAAVQAGKVPSEKSKRGVFGEEILGLNLDDHQPWASYGGSLEHHQPSAHSYSVIHQEFIHETPVVHHQAPPVIVKKYVPVPVVKKVIVPVTKTVVVPVHVPQESHGWSNSYASGW